MINKELLRSISEFDEKKEMLDYPELVDNIDVMEKAHAKIHSLLITTRMKKLMQDFGQRETDIYVVSYPRSGTTMMQMILYQMTTNGNVDFQHIYDVSPWCRFSALFKRPMPSVGERRIIKTHDSYSMHESNRVAKFIFITRDCLDVIPSIYQQTLDYVDPSVSFEELSNRNMINWLDYNSTWIENKNGLNILYLNYEDVVEKKREVISILSKFLDVSIDEPSIERVLERTSLKFMKQHESKFGEQPEHWKVYNNFIRTGQIGKGKFQFTDNQLIEYRELSKQYKIDGTLLQRYFV